MFHGNKVSDENDDHAIFAELGSSPASMKAAKIIIDVFGSQPGYSKQQADARQAYTQALFTGIKLGCGRRSIAGRRSGAGEGPVCPLRLALYGHPGGFGSNTAQSNLALLGWVAVLPEILQSIFYRAELDDLLLVVYVDDFKMAGPEANLAEGWNTEDYWEVDPEVGAVIRHHIYPRKKLYLPTEADIKLYPTLQMRVTKPEDEEDSTLDDPNENPRGKKDKWWTGQTCFPLIDVDPKEFRMALAARKGPPKRSKAEAKREATQKRSRRSPFPACPNLMRIGQASTSPKAHQAVPRILSDPIPTIP